MGNEYSRIKGRVFPQNCFLVGFRQPDVFQVINASSEMSKMLRQTVASCWHPGVRSERKLSLGFELRLEKEPFDSEIKPVDRLVSVYKMVNQLLKAITDAGCTLVTSGIFLQGACRSAWVLRLPDELPADSTGSSADLLTVAFEDWGRLLTVNAPSTVVSQLKSALTEVWPKGFQVLADEAFYFLAELPEQPWDSYKPDSDWAPLIVLALTRILAQHGYAFLAASHARGNMDCLTFVRRSRHSDGNTQASSLDKTMILSLNQRDQLRLYDAPDDIVLRATAFCRENWTPGCLREEASCSTIAPSMRRLHLKSSPWYTPDWDRSTATNARELLQELLKEICSLGWTVVLNADIYRSAYDKSLLLLRKSHHNMVQPHLSVAIQGANHLLVIGASEELKDKLMGEVREVWTRSQQCDAVESASGWLVDFVFNDNPWQWDPENPDVSIDGLGLLVALMEFLANLGWRLVANIDATSSSKFSPTTWLFQLKMDDIRKIKIG